MSKLRVYILLCSDGTYYTGVTNDIERRLKEHQSGFNPDSYTFSKRPVELQWCSDPMSPNEAIQWEKRIKRWSNKKKQALIMGDWDSLIVNSNRQFKCLMIVVRVVIFKPSVRVPDDRSKSGYFQTVSSSARR